MNISIFFFFLEVISVPGEAITENSPLRTMFSLIQSHQQAIACEFADKYGEKYATSKFEKLAVDGKNYCATFSSFSLVIDESGYVAAERPAYASSNYQAIVQFSELENQNGFSFLKSIGPVSNEYAAQETGDWTIASSRISPLCVSTAATDLVLTYQASGKPNLSLGLAPSELGSFFNDIFAENNSQAVSLSVFENAFSDYLDACGYSLEETDLLNLKPAIAFYKPTSAGGIGHAALWLGEAETSAFLFFKRRYDIVATVENYQVGREGLSFSLLEKNLGAIESSYRERAYAISPIPASC